MALAHESSVLPSLEDPRPPRVLALGPASQARDGAPILVVFDEGIDLIGVRETRRSDQGGSRLTG